MNRETGHFYFGENRTSVLWADIPGGSRATRTRRRLERQYFLFGEPIDTTRFAGRHADCDACLQLRDEVKAVVEREIHDLEAIREADPERYPVQRLLRHLAKRIG